jgi:hypothetical protein
VSSIEKEREREKERGGDSDIRRRRDRKKTKRGSEIGRRENNQRRGELRKGKDIGIKMLQRVGPGKETGQKNGRVPFVSISLK